ncbi:MAG: GLPGLI family protein [Bacteroidetes bacterium]|nr:GLPGLI family protein [Bacteroidota bacterium]
MKKQIFTIICATSIVAVTAQTSGKVTYEEKVKFEMKLEGIDSAMMARFPKEHTITKVLYYTPEVSLYQNDKSKKNKKDIEQSEGGNHMIVKMDTPDDQAFCDLKNNKQIEQRDFMSRKFLIETNLDKMEWKLTGNQKMILNYPCQEALLKDTTKKVSAWFTPEIAVSTGPAGYSNLPGLIMELDQDNGKRVITAKGIDATEFDKKLLSKPTEGKKVTKEQFNKIVDEKRKEMQAQNGGNGNIMIKINNN